MVSAFMALGYIVMTDDVVFYEFILGTGAMVGYLFATLLGVPAYILYFRHLNPVQKLPFVWFTLACLAGYCVLFGAIMVSHSGLGALLSSTFIGYGVIFFGSSATAVTAFYLIAFQEFWGAKSSG